MSTILKLAELCAVDELTQIIRRDKRSLQLADDGDNTLLHIAFAKGNGALVLTLINAGADPTKLNRDGMTPLQLMRDGIDHSVCFNPLLARFNVRYYRYSRSMSRTFLWKHLISRKFNLTVC